MRNKALLAAGIVLILAMLGCSRQEDESDAPASTKEENRPPEQVELIVSAAASLTDSLKEIQTLYERLHPNVKLAFNFGSSGTLQQQIEQGAPADLFLSAGKKQMDALVDKQLVDGSRQKNLLTNELVVIVPSDAKFSLNRLDQLTAQDIRKVAAGEPETVPAGGYAKEALTFFKLWEPLQPKLVLAKDVRQVLSYVETGNADAGFVYRTDALTSRKVKIAFTVDAHSYRPIEYPVVIVKSSAHPKEAEEFFEYLQGKEATDVFVKYGFTAVNP